MHTQIQKTQQKAHIMHGFDLRRVELVDVRWKLLVFPSFGCFQTRADPYKYVQEDREKRKRVHVFREIVSCVECLMYFCVQRSQIPFINPPFSLLLWLLFCGVAGR